MRESTVERLVRGYDSVLRKAIEEQIASAVETTRKRMGASAASMLQQALDRAETSLPADVDTELPTAPEITIPWDQHQCDIAYGNLPLQDAVDLASFLVSLQSGKAKFAEGTPTVGGRTHVGVITRHEGFRMLGEPELRHTHVGFM
jgi:hypothetical protein